LPAFVRGRNTMLHVEGTHMCHMLRHMENLRKMPTIVAWFSQESLRDSRI